jgi:hypothetical protein
MLAKAKAAKQTRSWWLIFPLPEPARRVLAFSWNPAGLFVSEVIFLAVAHRLV